MVRHAVLAAEATCHVRNDQSQTFGVSAALRAGEADVAVGSSMMDMLKNRLPYVWRWLGMAIAIIAIVYLFH